MVSVILALQTFQDRVKGRDVLLYVEAVLVKRDTLPGRISLSLRSLTANIFMDLVRC